MAGVDVGWRPHLRTLVAHGEQVLTLLSDMCCF